MKKYDKSSYTVLKSASASGRDRLTWWSGGEYIYQNIDTAVHEETHSLVYGKGNYDYSAGGWKLAYHLDNGKYAYAVNP